MGLVYKPCHSAKPYDLNTESQQLFQLRLRASRRFAFPRKKRTNGA